MFLGIEIGGTKLQIGLGADDGILQSLWRETVNVAAGPDGIRRQIQSAIPDLLSKSGVDRSQLVGVGIGFGGPVDDATRTIIKSHQIEGWNNFPLADWVADMTGLPAALGNDADVAGLAEALHGAGKGLSPIFYITVGSGIGGGFIIDGEIYRGCGRGAAEIGHLRIEYQGKRQPLEQLASGWGIEQHVRGALNQPSLSFDLTILQACLQNRGIAPKNITAKLIAEAAQQGDPLCRNALRVALECLAEGICHIIALLCPKRIIVGGGVSLLGEKAYFEPLRALVAERCFKPFAGLTDIVPAALGEEVVVHGAIALARQRWSKTRMLS